MTDPRERQAKMAGSQIAALSGLPVMMLVALTFVAYAEGYPIIAGLLGVVAIAVWIKMVRFAARVGEQTAERVKEVRRND